MYFKREKEIGDRAKKQKYNLKKLRTPYLIQEDIIPLATIVFISQKCCQKNCSLKSTKEPADFSLLFISIFYINTLKN